MLFAAHDDRLARDLPVGRKALHAQHVACSNESGPTTPISCFGNCSRDIGHSRVPEPPARITGTRRRQSRIAAARHRRSVVRDAALTSVPYELSYILIPYIRAQQSVTIDIGTHRVAVRLPYVRL